MKVMPYISRISVFAILVLLIFIAETKAQFNVLATDTLNKGEIYLELGSTFKTNNQEFAQRFTSFFPRVAYGVTRDFEVGVTMLGNVQPGEDATIISPMFKMRVYENEKHGIAVSIGNNLYIPVRNKTYKFGSNSLIQARKIFNKTGTQITLGGYHYTKHIVAENAQRAGAMFGIEQPVNNYFGVAADWITGKHAAGYFTSGFYFKPSKRMIGYVGYSIGNEGAARGNHYVFANIGISLH